MDDYLSYYGLKQEPFSGPAYFFSGAQRQDSVDQLQHYCQFSSGAVVLEGEPGVGKSFILEQLAQVHPEGQPLSFVAAPVMASAEQLMASLAAELGMHLSEGSSAGAMASQLRHQLQGIGHQALIIIDDAHNLDDQVLSALLSLLQGQEPGAKSSNLVLSGDNGLAMRLDSFGLVDILINDVQLQPFSVGETRDYIEQRLQQAGFEGDMPFSADELEVIWQNSAGRPGDINTHAEQLLISKLYRRPERVAGLPIGHMVLAVALLAVLIVSYLYKDELLGEQQPEQDQQAAESVADVGSSADSAFAVPIEPGADIAEQVIDQQADALRDVVDSAAAQQQQADDRAVLSDGLPQDQAKSSRPAVHIGLPVKTIAKKKAESKQADAQAAIADQAVGQPVVADQNPEPGPKLDLGKKLSPKPVEPKAKVKKEPEEDPNTISADEKYLLALDDGDFVLQLLAAPTRAGAKQVVAAMPNRGKVKIYPRNRNGKTWYVVVLPGFKSGAEARRAAKTYNSDVWPRNVSHIHQDIKAYRGI